MRCLIFLACVCLSLLGCSAQPTVAVSQQQEASPSIYESLPDAKGNFLRLRCEGNSLFTGACVLFALDKGNIQLGSGTKTKFEQPSAYLDLLKSQVVGKAQKTPDLLKNTLSQAADIRVVQSIQLTAASCKADKEYFDLMVACSHASEKPASVVLFMRGLCDRCEFEPIVIRKK
jgi:hypothetical protein